jgi:hypothetical protein
MEGREDIKIAGNKRGKRKRRGKGRKKEGKIKFKMTGN